MRKAIVMTLGVLVGLSACGSDSKQSSPATTASPTASTTTAAPSAPAASSDAKSPTSGVATTTAPTGAKSKMVTLYVASGLIPKGTTGREAFDKNLLEPQRYNANAVPAHALTNPDAVSDKVAVADIGAGKFVLETDFASK